jgi:HK97 family phage major capsid protein
MKNHRMPLVAAAVLASADRLPSAVVGSVCSESEDLSRGDNRNVTRVLSEVRQEIARITDNVSGRVDRLEVRQTDVEQAIAGGGGRRFSSNSSEAWGDTVTQSAEYQAFVANGCKGKHKIGVASAITSVGTSGGALIRPDRAEGVIGPRRRLTIRSLLGPGRTGSNSVEYFREKVFTNNAAPVAEGAQKPESNIEYELDDAKVRTIAHWVPASRQVMDDAPQLGSLIDSTLRYGLAIKEEQELLYGDGTGEHLLGMIPQATAYAPTISLPDENEMDVILLAIAQAELADLPASGVIMNTLRWRKIMGVKDSEGRYLSNGPFAGGPGTLWGLPVVWTNSIEEDEFLVGAFETATQIFDRMLPEVLISDEDRDNFIKNMLTVRAEERLAFAVKRPAALIHGNFDEALGL